VGYSVGSLVGCAVGVGVAVAELTRLHNATVTIHMNDIILIGLGE
jgi:hypothetical protein